MFYDELKVTLSAGKGGDGCMSFRREKYIPFGGPDGGNGGRGGSVYLLCDENVGDLRQFHFSPTWKADNGKPGQGRDKHGKSGKDLELKFPPGSIFTHVETGEKLAELTKHGQRIQILKGGDGGVGNTTFKSSTNQAPRQFTRGKPGEEAIVHIEVKTIADIGLVGYPNAGKSTLIGILTNASPRTAPYPFTTKQPSMGFLNDEANFRRLRIADIPGLIEGAHENRGLGHQFLRHIERCRLLVILIDIAGVDQRNPFDDYLQLLQEMKLYSETLAAKPYIVALNKTDLLEDPSAIKAFNKSLGQEALEISCLTQDGIPDLINLLFDELAKLD